MKAKSCIETTFSKALDKNRSLEIGLKLLTTEGLRFGFFKRGWTTACLKECVKILGPAMSITSPHELINLVGRKSRLQVGGFICDVSFVRKGREPGSKQLK